MSSRHASHAGNWYSSSDEELGRQLTGWLNDVHENAGHACAVISPHAGYSYCGASAAHAYKQINPALVKRIFILGPSHHVYLPGCALSSLDMYQTPFYSLKIDQEIYKELGDTDKFTRMPKDMDEDEHSIEMQLPYIAKVMEKQTNFTIVPVLVGSLSREKEVLYGRLFSKYLEDPDNLFVISSDFCHWGRRFKYTYYEKKYGDIYESIEQIDKIGMKLIEELDPEKFHGYLKKYGNTICGRHPIGVFLNGVEALHKEGQAKYKFKFLDYRQSDKCRHQRDSSVSYASGYLEKVSLH